MPDQKAHEMDETKKKVTTQSSDDTVSDNDVITDRIAEILDAAEDCFNTVIDIKSPAEIYRDKKDSIQNRIDQLWSSISSEMEAEEQRSTILEPIVLLAQSQQQLELNYRKKKDRWDAMHAKCLESHLERLFVRVYPLFSEEIVQNAIARLRQRDGEGGSPPFDKYAVP